MKLIQLLAASLSIAAVTSGAAFAQGGSTMPADSKKPMVMMSPTSGKPVIVVPPGASMVDMYKAGWAFRNLDATEVRRYRLQGFTDNTIRGAANIALSTGLEIPYVLRQVREVGTPLYTLATSYGIDAKIVDADIPGFGAEALSMPAMMPMGGMNGSMGKMGSMGSN